ncbi:MAG: hypothetical protein D6737_16205 [Chloroflexi bacterium]|nr:MAG: hypothetical protein D6737_16205 [Chloroflexota bacterium]
MHSQLATKWLLLIPLVLLLLLAVSVTQAQEDSRINRVDPLGGATIYCVGANNIPNTDWTQGGILVTNINGSETLLFVSAADIQAASPPLEENVKVGMANGLSLYRLAPDGTFQLNGFYPDGKLFEFQWTDCNPISAPSEPEPEPENNRNRCPEVIPQGVTAFGEIPPDPCDPPPCTGPYAFNEVTRFGTICPV